MPVIIISSDLQELEQKTAGLISESSSFRILTREDIFPVVAERYNVPEEDLHKVLDKRPNILRSSFRYWNMLLAFIQEAVFHELSGDNIVCYGLASHLYVRGVSHVLRARILSGEDERIRMIMAHSGVNRQTAFKLLDREKKYRSAWSADFFKMDETDSSKYDLSINLNNIDLDEAIKLIEETVSSRRFKTMTYSIKCMEDLALAARARALLIKDFPDINVRANNGKLIVTLLSLRRQKKKKTRIIKEMTGEIKGVDYVEIHVYTDYFGQAAESFR